MNTPNRLIYETSPYLLQHAYNPVDWFPWGEEAFQKAKSENKLIFLSIGYSTCHWCHVMEKESFEDEETASILNRHFISIKVDREELPEVDSIYMNALHLMGQQGGWPLNMFLTPDLKPITGGTYFPKERKWGMLSFKEVLKYVLNLWNTKKEQLIEISNQITNYLNSRNFMSNEEIIDIKQEHFEKIIGDFYQYFDPHYGGFLVNQKNKFPPSLNLLFLIALYKKFKKSECLEMIETTLINIRKGGIYDQLGGGIARYATDHQWRVPHFEKTLYDNALYANVLIEAYKLTKKEIYKEISIEVLDYLFRNLYNPEGGFYSAEDADSEGEEGKFYVWRKQEMISILERNDFKTKEIEQVLEFFGVTDGGNFESNQNVLYIKQEKLWEYPFIKKAREILFRERNKRILPFKDEKILTSWNALMISTLCNAYLTFENPIYLEKALKTFEFITLFLTQTSKFTNPLNHGFLKRSYNPKKNKVFYLNANLADYALLACCLLDLYKATAKEIYLMNACLIKDYILKYFYKDGVFYETEENIPYLIVRPFDFYDGVIPSSVSATIRLFLKLADFGFVQKEIHLVENFIKKFYPVAIQHPFSYSYFLLEVFQYYFLNQQIVIRIYQKQFLKELIHFFGKHTFLESSIFYNFPGSEFKADWIKEENNQNLDYVIYICKNFSCSLPISDIKKINEFSFY